MSERSWQLIMSGHGLEHVPVEARLGMERLLDLMPSITHLTLEVGDHRIHVTRDWPSSRMEEADHLLRRIACTGGICAIVVPGNADEPARRVAAGTEAGRHLLR
jgi:hypothetical protein